VNAENANKLAKAIMRIEMLGGHLSLRKGPSEEDLFQIGKLLVTPVPIKFISERLRIPVPTVYRWLNEFFSRVVEERNGLYWLRGYAGGEPCGSVIIPKEGRWLNIYLRLGWEYQDETQGHVILRQGRASSEPDEDVIPSDFRVFRDYTLITGCDMRNTNEEFCSNFFRVVCAKCPRKPYHAPTLQDLCPKCGKKGSYELAKQKLQSLSISTMQPYVLTYLSYEYRKELMLLMEKRLREAYEKRDLGNFYRLWAAFRSRYEKLKRQLLDCGNYDLSLEDKLLHWFPQLVKVSQDDAHKLIKTTLDFVRWHQMDEQGLDPVIIHAYQAAGKEYEKLAAPILGRVVQQTVSRLH
jgi:hypothetical protein